MNNTKFPKNWETFKVKDLFKVLGGGTPSTSVEEYWNGTIPWITSADILGLKEIRPRKFVSQFGIANSATNLVPKDSIIVVTRVGLGKIAMADIPLCFSQDSQALVAKGNNVNIIFALYYLSQVVQMFKYQSRGTTISGVTKKQLLELPFPLPILSEQERIVAKIEELFSQLDAGVGGLKRIQGLLKHYRASVLKAAFEGRLVPQRPDDEPAGEMLRRMGKKPLERDGLPSLPDGWVWATIGDIVTFHYGKSLTKTNRDSNGKIPVFGSNGIVGHHSIPLVEKPCLIVGRKGSAGAVHKSEIPCWPIDTTYYVIPPEKIHINYIFYLFKSIGLVGLDRSTAIPGLNRNDAYAKIIPLPPTQEQKRIVNALELLLTFSNEVEINISKLFLRSARLRQSILNSAFQGKLV